MRPIVDFIASFFCLGKLPFAPGTFGTAGAFLIVLALQRSLPQLGGLLPGLLIAIPVSVLSVYASEHALRLGLYTAPVNDSPAEGTKHADPKQIVIDEVAGFFIAAAGAQGSIVSLSTAFVLFRVFDIVKPPPLRQLEKLPGGWGITADDLAAGILALIGTELIGAAFPEIFGTI